MSAVPAPSVNAYYVAEVSRDDPRRTIHGFSPYSPVPVSPSAVQEAITAADKDLAAIQLAHYWLQADRWIRKHNDEVDEAERVQRDLEDMRKVEEQKKAEIEEDRRQRAEWAEKKQRELEWKRKGKGRAREDSPEASPSRSRKRRAESESEGHSSKTPKMRL